MCVCVCRCSSTGPQSVNAPLGFVQRVRPADEPCQTTPVYLSFFCWDACPGWETLDEALEEEEKKTLTVWPSSLHAEIHSGIQAQCTHKQPLMLCQTNTHAGEQNSTHIALFLFPPLLVFTVSYST